MIGTHKTCRHEIDGHLVPCPAMCPVQMWPRGAFRPRCRIFGRLVLKDGRQADD